MGFDLIAIIKSVGYFGVWGTIFAETGIVFGILLPGDSLLFAVGLLARQGVFDITIVSAGCFVAAFVGNLVGYEIGKRLGLPFIKKYASRIVTDKHLAKTESFFKKYGRSGIVVARFVPVARTVAPFLAGVIRMDYMSFVLYSAFGALVWGVGLPLLGYYLAGFIPPEMIDLLLLPVVLIILFIIFWPWVQSKWEQRKNNNLPK